MADVARRADVSIKTVSRVVNGEPGVSPATAARVREIIDKLGFQRHADATMLRTGRSDRIGLVATDLVNPFYGQLAAGIEREARLRRHLLISTSSQQSAVNEAELVEALVAQRVPVVCVDRPQPDLGVDTVLSDNEGGIRSAVEHLAAHRHERLGFLGDDGAIWTARVRKTAFDSAAASLGLRGPLRSRVGPYTSGEIGGLLREWTSGPDPVTAVVTGNNRVTVAVLHAMREAGLTLALVGYDDFELADLIDPPVTVVHQEPLELGERAVQQVFARLAAGAGEPRTVIVPTRLVVRGSGRSQPVPVAMV
jgi:LacI family transcriptional regulator